MAAGADTGATYLKEQVVKESSEQLDLMIDAYLDGRMEPAARARFEERMKNDPALREKVLSATHSLEMVQKALGWVTPGNEFEAKVSSKIVALTQSGHNLQPATASRSLTRGDPDAQFLADPAAAREKWRLLILAILAALVLSGAVALIVTALNKEHGATLQYLAPDIKTFPEK
jgi:anti-sigma factor RsiW